MAQICSQGRPIWGYAAFGSEPKTVCRMPFAATTALPNHCPTEPPSPRFPDFIARWADQNFLSLYSA
jgi:hypothetical protein